MPYYTPPQAVQRAAARGLALREQQTPSNRGGTAVGLARARQLSNGDRVSIEVIARMVSYFARHEVDKQAPGWGDESNPSKGWQAWLLWGGDPGRAWANRIWKEYQEENSVHAAYAAYLAAHDPALLLYQLNSVY